MMKLTMVVNSTNKNLSLTEISGLGLCNVDYFNAKSVKLIDDKQTFLTVINITIGRPTLKLHKMIFIG